VKLTALADEIPVFEPVNPNDDVFVAQVRALAPDVAVVVAYGHILKPALLAVPRLGSFNVHASLLPKLRGAAPIERAILEGLTETGVTIMRMEAGLDTGPALHTAATPIADDETGGELRVRLAEIGALALVEALTLLDEAGITPTPQDHAQATHAPKLTRDEERIDWTLPAELVARKIRAFDPKPGAWSEIRGKAVKLYGARALSGIGNRESGIVAAVGDTITIACGAGAVDVMDVQPAGKARMTARAFVNGRGVAVGDVLA
jgi:methionyl-tRNA formyltransferase